MCIMDSKYSHSKMAENTLVVILALRIAKAAHKRALSVIELELTISVIRIVHKTTSTSLVPYA